MTERRRITGLAVLDWLHGRDPQPEPTRTAIVDAALADGFIDPEEEPQLRRRLRELEIASYISLEAE